MFGGAGVLALFGFGCSTACFVAALQRAMDVWLRRWRDAVRRTRKLAKNADQLQDKAGQVRADTAPVHRPALRRQVSTGWLCLHLDRPGLNRPWEWRQGQQGRCLLRRQFGGPGRRIELGARRGRNGSPGQQGPGQVAEGLPPPPADVGETDMDPGPTALRPRPPPR